MNQLKNNTQHTVSATYNTEWVILSYNLKQRLITTITNETPEGGTRMMTPNGNRDDAVSAYRLLEQGDMQSLFNASKLADTWYAKKGNLVLLFGTDMRFDPTVGKKRNKRVARSHAPATHQDLPIPVIKFEALSKVNDGHGWISPEYLSRNNIKCPKGRLHFSFTYQKGDTQYKGACVVAKLPEGIDMVIPDDGKAGVLYEGEFFNLTMGYSHTEPRIDPQWLSNTIRWIDYSGVIQAHAKSVVRNITDANVPGRHGLNPYVKAGVLPALIEEYRKQEVSHLAGEVKGMFKIPAVTGLIAFSKSVPKGHIKIDRNHGLIVCNPSDYVVFQFILGGMDGDDHVIFMFTSDTDGKLFRQPNQLGECVTMKLWGSERKNYTQLPPVRVVGDEPKPVIKDMVEYTPALEMNDYDMFKATIDQQIKSATYIGRVANLCMYQSISGLPSVGNVLPDFEGMIGLELVDGNTSALDAWCDATQVMMNNYMGGGTTLPVSLQRKARVEGPTPYLGDVVHANLRALDEAIVAIGQAKAVRIGYDGLLARAKYIAPSLPSIVWVDEFGKMAIREELDKYPEYITNYIAETDPERFEQEVMIALARVWFTQGAGYALLQKGVYEVVCKILNEIAITEDALPAMNMFNLKMDIPETVYVSEGGMYTAKGDFVGVCKVADGAYTTSETTSRKSTVHVNKYQRWQFATRTGELTSYRKRIIRNNETGLPESLRKAS
ncbi:MAG: hypothetical protein SFZ02_12420 [bacterium]|nr:hypothetical protein [bacterium]